MHSAATPRGYVGDSSNSMKNDSNTEPRETKEPTGRFFMRFVNFVRFQLVHQRRLPYFIVGSVLIGGAFLYASQFAVSSSSCPTHEEQLSSPAAHHAVSLSYSQNLLRSASSSKEPSYSFLQTCSHTSEYVHQRAKETKDPECKQWLSSMETFDRFSSQFGQDAFLYYNFFRCMDGPGTYLDIGAYLPKELSNTWFYDVCLGWKGICAEGNTVQAAHFRKERSCFVIDKAISLKPGSGAFTSAGVAGHITVTDTQPGATGGELTQVTAAQALKEAGWYNSNGSPIRIDFLSLDVELHELEVLFAIPWDTIDLRFAAIENNKNAVDVWEYMMDHGFIMVGSLSVDDIYMRLSPTTPLLWNPSNAWAMRKRDNKYRRDIQHSPPYQRPALYEGWDHVAAYVEKHGSMPTA